jgi:5-methylcytosine-specific restriction endonuclease McrA
MNLKTLSNQELHQHTRSKAESERRLTLEILWHLRENERRMLYAQMGYRDLKEYCIKELKYSEGSAWRRISAMRLLKEVPEVEIKIQSGELNLTQVSMVQSHFREVKATLAEKKEILLEIENQTKKSTERVLAERKPENLIETQSETEKPKRGGKLEVTLVLDEDLQAKLDEIQILLGSSHSKLELFRFMTEQTLKLLRKKSEPKVKSQLLIKPKMSPHHQCKAPPLRSRGAAKSRYIPVGIRKKVQLRDRNRCQYKGPISGRQCESTLHLQIDHKLPFAKGGNSDPENLQLLCATHNRLRAVQQFGIQKMREYLPSIG